MDPFQHVERSGIGYERDLVPMMAREEFVDVVAMKRRGKTCVKIAEDGYHPAMISNWVCAGGPSAVRTVGVKELLIDEGPD